MTTGLFAIPVVNSNGQNELFCGSPHQFFLGAFGILVVGSFSFAGAYFLLKLPDVITSLRVTPEEEEKRLDLSEHGEVNYE